MSKIKPANTCAICGRGYNKANIRSHSKIATIKKQKLNLQPTMYKGVKVKACTKCIKTQIKHQA
ncbi:MAG: bL28 family ribosomal protein [Patescibacteria group bacterium]